MNDLLKDVYDLHVHTSPDVAPHIGGATREASTRSSVACAQAIDDYFSGRTPKFIVPELRDLV